MLNALFIQNLAVVEKAFIEFERGLNVFTGETGAGKSIITGALGAILGNRVNRDIVRSGANKTVISAIFIALSDEVLSKAESFGVEIPDGELIVQREIFPDGRSAARICGFPVTAAILKEIGALMINVHGQHDTQVLLSPDRHLDILDTYGGLLSLREEYAAAYNGYKKAAADLEAINKEQENKAERMDMLLFQINEIENSHLSEGEDEELETEAHAIRNAARITENLEEANFLLSGDDDFDGAVDKVNSASLAITRALEYYSELGDLSEKLEGLSYELAEIAGQASSFADSLDFNQEHINAIEERLDVIFKLKRKYGGTIPKILEFEEKARAELQKIEMYDVRLNELITMQKKNELKMQKLASRLTEERKAAGERFARSVCDELEFLDMPNVRLEGKISSCELYAKGAERFEFFISANVGENLRPLSKIASGGELARIMLAIKNTMADKDEIPTLIFDEIDSGVSGQAAQKIGMKLKQAAQNRQIICVTHLAQVAAQADCHLLIKKNINLDRTYTSVEKLDFNGRKYEIARIMSAGEITELMLENAHQILLNAN
ncbi:MAG: DNA repair protein RecN [Oscillospiraceae bacterium]|nr:DNA repair protein RecN [Oscillospiraceae bacterium]